MSQARLIKDRRLPIWGRPLRAAYRMVRSALPSRQALTQVRVRGTDYLVWANEDIGKKLILLRSFEPDEIRAFERLVRPGDVCFDVGGNVGFYALNLARMATAAGQVFSFEPLRRNALVIELAAPLNGFDTIEVVETALSDRDDVFVPLEVPAGDGAYAHLSTDMDTGGADRAQVRCMTIDRFVADRGLGRVDVMKVDVEGAEHMVLAGARGMLADEGRRPRVIMAELIDDYLARFDSSIEAVIKDLASFGYVPHRVVAGGQLRPFTAADHDQVFNVFFLTEGGK